MIILILSAIFVSGFTGLIFVKFYYQEYDVLRFNRISSYKKNGTNLVTGERKSNQSAGTANALKDTSYTKKKEFQRTTPKITNVFVENNRDIHRNSTLFDSFAPRTGTKAYRLHSGPSAFKTVNDINNRCTALSQNVVPQGSFSPLLIIFPCLILFVIVIAIYLIQRLCHQFCAKKGKGEEKVTERTIVNGGDYDRTDDESVALVPSQAQTSLPSATNLDQSSSTTALEDLTTLVQERVPLPHRFIKKVKIGEGGFGQVYKALDWTTNKMVAIKVIKSESNIMPKNLIPREVKIWKKLSHDNVVTMENYYPEGASFNIVMELLSGGAIRQFLRAGPLPENYVSCIAKQIFSGLEYLHSMKIVHGDIKTFNILYTLSGKIKIADFGLSFKLKEIRKYGLIQECTPYYVAPELLRRKPYGVKVDVWAAGISLIELLQGETPSIELPVNDAKRTNASMGIRLLNEPESYSEEAVDFLRNALNPRPKDRWHSHMLLKHQFLEKAPPPAALIPLIIKVRNLPN